MCWPATTRSVRAATITAAIAKSCPVASTPRTPAETLKAGPFFLVLFLRFLRQFRIRYTRGITLPLLTGRYSPVITRARSDARKQTALAMSSSVARRRIGKLSTCA